MPAVAVFGSSAAKPGFFEYDTARLIGDLLGKNGFDVITGGYDGVMEAALRGAVDYPVGRIGVTFKNSTGKVKNKYVATEIITQDYIERLYKLIDLAEAFIVLPGGTGTLLEFSSLWALKQRRIIDNKPVVCLGEQWLEVMQTLCFYSETILDNLDLIDNAESAMDAVQTIIQKLNQHK